MTTQNWCAIVGMLAIVITLYALRESHLHWMPDLFGLALALAAPRQSYAIGAVALLAIVRHSGLARGLSDGVPVWLLPILLPGARNMSISDDESSALESAYKERVSGEETNLEYVEIPQPVAETSQELITFAESEILAKLVIAGAIGLTEAVQIGAGAKSGKKYQKHSRLVKEAIERQRNHYPAGSTLKRFDK
jgi:hypothetical protein